MFVGWVCMSMFGECLCVRCVYCGIVRGLCVLFLCGMVCEWCVCSVVFVWGVCGLCVRVLCVCCSVWCVCV